MKHNILLISLLIIAVFSESCNKNNIENWHVLKKLYRSYKSGQIEECTYEGKTIYSAGINAYDMGYEVYDYNGNKIASCGYWGGTDSVCYKAKDCHVIYRCKGHLTGQPPIDVYGLD